MKNKNKFLYALLFFGLILFSACSNSTDNMSSNLGSDNKNNNFLQPEEVVRTYYESLDNKDYETMYGLISDGFKKIDPEAKDIETFSDYMSKFYDTSSGVKVISTNLKTKTKKKAYVDYKIVIISKNGGEIPFESTFTMKMTNEGWKLIHPYGDNIDTSD